ncbi:MAG: hypothetical protein SGI77_14830 [Pirellulaceae bacterium]|nr:hypothetical protein [Pirellulaceae bacterium]
MVRLKPKLLIQWRAKRKFCVVRLGLCLIVFLSSVVLGLPTDAEAVEAEPSQAIIVIGASGTDEYFDDFKVWAYRWQAAFPESMNARIIGDRDEVASAVSDVSHSSRQQILEWIEDGEKSEDRERWLILIGHGTYQLKVANFNAVGPDLSADDLANAISACPARWRIVVCASSSAPFLNALSGPNRVIVTATKSGSEQNFSRFGDYLSQSIMAPTSDLDHDGSVSILEAFVVASGNLAKWYADEGRIASEQALIDDNGDQRGTPANFFRGVRAAKAPVEGSKMDGTLARRVYVREHTAFTSLTETQQLKIVELENEIEAHRLRKQEFSEAEYFAKLETYLVELAHLLVPSEMESTSRVPP